MTTYLSFFLVIISHMTISVMIATLKMIISVSNKSYYMNLKIKQVNINKVKHKKLSKYHQVRKNQVHKPL